MPYSLRPNLHICRVSSGYILLDLCSSRYTLLCGQGAEHLRQFIEQEAGPVALCWLLEAKLICEGPDERKVHASSLTLARQSFLDFANEEPSWFDVIGAVRNQNKARRDLRRRNLAQIFHEIGMDNSSPRRFPRSTALATAYTFFKARRYISALDQCLPRGIAMKRMLNKKGCAAQLVIGITMPFSAHCWVQADQILLTDQLEVIAGFEPILVIP